jgi:hypothetical protein
LVKNDFGRNTRIGATDNNGKRMLTLRQLCASLCCIGGGHAKEIHASIFIAIGCDVCSFLARLVWVLRLAARVAAIAFFEPGHRFGWRHDRLISVGRVGSLGKLVADAETCRDAQERKGISSS